MSKESRKLRRRERREANRMAWARKMREEPGVFWTYVILRAIVLFVIIRSLFNGYLDNAIVCAFVLLYVLPQFVENRMNIEIPSES